MVTLLVFANMVLAPWDKSGATKCQEEAGVLGGADSEGLEAVLPPGGAESCQ